MTTMSFQSLPPELYDSIFSHIPPFDLQCTVLAVTRAIPLSSVSLYHLFRNVRINRPEQIVQLYQRLRQSTTAKLKVLTDNRSQSEDMEPASWVRDLSIESWTVDAEIVINMLRILPKLQSLNIWVGPSNFAPEHLEELFARPLTLQYLAIRFRPYVQKANYYQFLKGAYFDSALLALARWLSGPLSTLSIVQDSFDPGLDQIPAFAQPIVFFRLDPCLSVLLHSPSMAPSLKALRLRIPSRPVARPLCGTSATTPYASDLTPASDLEFLDLSTCSILESEVDMILDRFPSLKHLILDGCSILRGEGDWNSLGKRCALAGVRRSKQRERALKAWIEANQFTDSMSGDDNSANPEKRVKRGRKGLASATISLREPRRVVLPSISRTTLITTASQNSMQRAAKIRILPSTPTLETLSITVPPWFTPDKYPIMRAEFDAGWAEGIALLGVTKARLRSSAKNGYRIMRPSITTTTSLEAQDECLEGLEGLENVDPGDEAAFVSSFDNKEESTALSPPILCFAGPGKDRHHEGRCGHSVGWELMRDAL